MLLCGWSSYLLASSAAFAQGSTADRPFNLVVLACMCHCRTLIRSHTLPVKRNRQLVFLACKRLHRLVSSLFADRLRVMPNWLLWMSSSEIVCRMHLYRSHRQWIVPFLFRISRLPRHVIALSPCCHSSNSEHIWNLPRVHLSLNCRVPVQWLRSHIFDLLIVYCFIWFVIFQVQCFQRPQCMLLVSLSPFYDYQFVFLLCVYSF